MKRLITFTFISQSLFPFIGYGATLDNPFSTFDTFPDFISILIDIFAFIATPVVVIYMIYAGYLIVSAGGDEEKLGEGKRAFIWGFVGATIILGATILRDVVATTMEGLAP